MPKQDRLVIDSRRLTGPLLPPAVAAAVAAEGLRLAAAAGTSGCRSASSFGEVRRAAALRLLNTRQRQSSVQMKQNAKTEQAMTAMSCVERRGGQQQEEAMKRKGKHVRNAVLIIRSGSPSEAESNVPRDR